MRKYKLGKEDYTAEEVNIITGIPTSSVEYYSKLLETESVLKILGHIHSIKLKPNIQLFSYGSSKITADNCRELLGCTYPKFQKLISGFARTHPTSRNLQPHRELFEDLGVRDENGRRVGTTTPAQSKGLPVTAVRVAQRVWGMHTVEEAVEFVAKNIHIKYPKYIKIGAVAYSRNMFQENFSVTSYEFRSVAIGCGGSVEMMLKYITTMKTRKLLQELGKTK